MRGVKGDEAPHVRRDGRVVREGLQRSALGPERPAAAQSLWRGKRRDPCALTARRRTLARNRLRQEVSGWRARLSSGPEPSRQVAHGDPPPRAVWTEDAEAAAAATDDTHEPLVSVHRHAHHHGGGHPAHRAEVGEVRVNGTGLEAIAPGGAIDHRLGHSRAVASHPRCRTLIARIASGAGGEAAGRARQRGHRLVEPSARPRN